MAFNINLLTFLSVVGVSIGRPGIPHGSWDNEYHGVFQRGPKFGNKIYFVSSNSGTWNSSINDCRLHFGPDAQLLSIETAEEQNFINRILPSYVSSGGVFWTSGHYTGISVTGQWFWGGSGNPISFTNWGVAEPKPPSKVSRIKLHVINRYASWWETDDDAALNKYICERSLNIQTTPKPIKCTVPADLVIVLDSSKSIGSDDFQLQLRLAMKLSQSFNSVPEFRLGILIFSTKISSVFIIGEKLTSEEMSDRILSFKYDPGTSPIDEAIAAAREMLKLCDHGGSCSYLVMTDGISNNPIKTKGEADAAVDTEIRTFALGVTDEVDEQELLNIAGGNKSEVFKFRDFETEAELLATIINKVCT